jgi:hypothetical protein
MGSGNDAGVVDTAAGANRAGADVVLKTFFCVENKFYELSTL